MSDEHEGAASGPTPMDMIIAGAETMNRGIVLLRREIEEQETAQRRRRAGLANGEAALVSLTIHARRAQHPRHVLPGEAFGPLRQLRDGARAAPLALPEARPVISPVDETTRRQLATMGLPCERGSVPPAAMVANPERALPPLPTTSEEREHERRSGRRWVAKLFG